MMRSSLALLFLAAVPAAASEQGDLLACFQALRPASEGPGVDIGAYERGGTLRPTVVVPVPKGGRPGFFIYTGDEPYFAPLPARVAHEYVIFWAFELKLPERDPFRCMYEDVDLPGHEASVRCSLLDSEPRYEPAKAQRLSYTSASRWPLKAAVLQRVSTVAYGFRKKAEQYGKDLDWYKRKKADPQGWEWLAHRVMDWPPRPSAPSPYDGEQALAACARTEDPEVASAVSTERALLRGVSVPRD